MKVGEVLVQKGLITRQQLKEALEAQLIYGGHLGTCLLELGAVTERLLGNVLAEVLDVGFAPPELFENIPRFTTSTIPDRLVDKHQAIPFRLQDRILDVALVDPKNLVALDEISFASGHNIRSWVAPEARIFQAMERYYDIPRRLRYVSLCREIDGHAEIEMLSDRLDRGPSGDSGRGPVSRAVASDATAGERAAAPPAPVVARTPAAATVAVEDADPLAPLARQLMQADSVDRVSEIALDHAARDLARSVVFVVRSGKALPWQGAGITADPARWARLSFPVTTEPMFTLLDGDDLYRGPVPNEPSYRSFFERLGMDAPREALVISAHVEDRLVALFYGDGGPGGAIRGEDEYFRRLVKKLGLALHMVQLRRSILNA